jgi:replication fork clamp-binding protein CrfC
MKGTIKTDRRYTLGEYKYTTLEDEIGDIPEKLMLDPSFTSLVRYLQLIGFEIAYRKYIKLVSTYPHTAEGMEKAIKELEKLRDSELKKLKIIMNGTSIKDDNINDTPLSVS